VKISRSAIIVFYLPVSVSSTILQASLVMQGRKYTAGERTLTYWKHIWAPGKCIPWNPAGVVAQNSRKSPPSGKFSR
ncbi:hypothetical protein EDC04DRAFT_2712436, partial [Pisolithus marmoratus]